MNKNLLSTCRIAIALSTGLAAAGTALGTDLVDKPLRPDLLAKPNVIFGMDNSGSMDAEILLYSVDGFFWWDFHAGTGWGVDPQHPDARLRSMPMPWFNRVGERSLQWRAFTYLFPNGKDLGNRKFSDAQNNYFAALPTSQFAFLRSPDHNSSYYDPRITYRPWADAWTASGPVSFKDADPRRARSHPLLGDQTLDLTREVALDTRPEFHFIAMPGALIPAGAQRAQCQFAIKVGAGESPPVVDPSGCLGWTETTSAGAAPRGTITGVAMPYYPATYWMKEACTPPATPTLTNDDCSRAPDGSTLKRYRIVPGAAFPTGRTYAAELQNFANWFQYFRKRRLALGAAMGQVLSSVSGMRVGVTPFHHRASVVEMHDADSATPSAGALRVAGEFYTADADLSTPTRETLSFIGRQFARREGDLVQAACQRNNAFIVTDGYANNTRVPMPEWDTGKSEATWGRGAPHERTFPGSLADLALRFYTNNPRPDLPTARLTPMPRDPNASLHVNTYGLSIGARGVLYNTHGMAAPRDAASWLNPDAHHSPISTDDLWHATLNGRGRMFLAQTAEQTAAHVRTALNDMLDAAGAQSSAAVSSVNLATGDQRIYRTSYNPNGPSGDVTAQAIDPATGEVDDTRTWSAAAVLDRRSWSNRVIASHDGARARPFSHAELGGLLAPASPDLFDYLRGDRSREGFPFRERRSLLGPVAHAKPVVAKEDGVLYAATGEGMLHAFDAVTGEELWGYVPYSVVRQAAQSADRNWRMRTLLDGTPVLGKAHATKVLVAGRGVAGAGYFALDVTRPRALSSSDLAAKVLWEFPNGSTDPQVVATLGASVGTPIVADTRRHGPVVLLTSGYNAPARDGRGRLYVLSALTGNVLDILAADSGRRGVDPGLAKVSALREGSGLVRFVYGGDELGNVWRFDLEATPSDPARTTRLARLTDAGGVAQPVTAAPELVRSAGHTLVLVGTGRLLGWSDFGSAGRQSFYAIKDGTPIADVRRDLTPRTLRPTSGGAATLGGDQADPRNARGWYFDMPAGQQANTDPVVVFGAVAFSTNRATARECDEESFFYLVDIATGLGIPGNGGAMTPLASRLASGVTALATDGSRPNKVAVGNFATSDNRVITRDLNIPLGIAPRKNAWREAVRH